MGEPRNQNVLSCLQGLEMEALGFQSRDPEEFLKKDKLHQIKCRTLSLRMQRKQLQAQIQALKDAKAELNERTADGNEMHIEAQKNPQLILPLLRARHTQLKDILHAHHLIGGFDVAEVDSGRRVCFTLSTAYEDAYLDTYHLELDLTRGVRIHRHDIPSSIPLKKLAEEKLEIDLPAFLHTLWQHVSGLASRLYQIQLVKEQLDTVTVMETNPLCSVLVLMCKVPEEMETALLFSLLFEDPLKVLPTQVTLESNNKLLPDEPQWKETKSLFLEMSPHKALLNLRCQGRII